MSQEFKKKIAILIGGKSSERYVSLMSAKDINDAIIELGHEPCIIDVDENIAQNLINIKPDLVFNALYGTYGEDGCIQGLLEILNIPYTHSNVLSSALAFNKQKSKDIFIQNGILCPEGKIVNTKDAITKDLLPRPYILKPIEDGSSVGVVIVKDENSKINPQYLANYDQYLIEKYIPGKELSVPVLQGKALGVIELKPKDGFYDYQNKYTDNKTEHIYPAKIPDDIYNQALEISQKAHNLLGCNCISRADFRYDIEGDGKLYLLEVNNQPGLTKLSIVPEVAGYCNISFAKLVNIIINNLNKTTNITKEIEANITDKELQWQEV